MKVKNIREKDKIIGNNFTGILEWCDGTKHAVRISVEYYKDGMLHRENNPARSWADGSKEWWMDGNYYYSITEN